MTNKTNLRDWLIEKNIKQSDFAKKLDVTRSHLCCIISNRRPASKKVAKKIEKLTNNEITQDQIRSGKALGYKGKSKRVKKEPHNIPTTRISLL